MLTKILLAAAIFLLALTLIRPIWVGAPVQAQSSPASLYVEPGVVSIRNPDGGGTIGDGKMVVDLKTGDVWGFPTYSGGAPYPVDPTSKRPPTSKPIYLGRFDFSEMKTP